VKSKRSLTQEERYILDYIGGARIALIDSLRNMLIKILHYKGKEQGRIPSKTTIQKINREIDAPWLGKVINAVYNDRLSLEVFELHYDKLFLNKDDSGNPEGLRNFDKLPLKGTTGVCE